MSLTDPIKRKPGRPRKVVVTSDETNAAAVVPQPEPRENTNPIQVAERDPVTGALIALHDDPGEPVELPDVHEEVAVAGIRGDEPIGGRILAAEDRLSVQQARALDRDFDGQAGGSRPKASLTELQKQAFTRDVVDAYEGQWEIKRTDAFNRVWTFRHEIVKNHDNMLIRVQRGPSVAERFIPSSVFSQGRAMLAIEEVDLETAR